MDIIKTNKKGSLIVISGPTCAGKGTICNELLKINGNIWRSISYTSRPIRGNEVNGVDYFFVTKEEFEDKIQKGEMLEYARVHYNDYYGTPREHIKEKLDSGIDVLLEIDIQGAIQIKEKVKDAIFIFILAPSMEEIKNRLIKRGFENNDQMIERFKTAYREINELTKYNYVVVNDVLSDAVNKVNSIITSEKCRVDRIEDVYLNNEEEVIHELLIDKNLKNEDLDL
jgi:guanylate kinase